jgi:hypothetical protein
VHYIVNLVEIAGAKSRAAAAAAVAAASVTPGQRDRAIQQAVLAAQQQRGVPAPSTDEKQLPEAEDTSDSSAADEAKEPELQQQQQQSPHTSTVPGTYDPPDWSGIPEGWVIFSHQQHLLAVMAAETKISRVLCPLVHLVPCEQSRQSSSTSRNLSALSHSGSCSVPDSSVCCSVCCSILWSALS